MGIFDFFRRAGETKEYENPYITGFELSDFCVLNVADLPTIECGLIIKQQDELVHYACPVQIYIDRERISGYEGKNSGISVRIAKGVSYRSGASNGVSLRETKRTIYNGTFVITNQRLVHICEKNAFDIKINKLTSIYINNNIVNIQINNKTYSIVVPIDQIFYIQTVLDIILGKNHKEPNNIDDPQDVLFEVYKLLVETGEMSASILQRKLRLPYMDAHNIILDLEQRGIISESVSGESGKLLLSVDEIKALI